VWKVFKCPDCFASRFCDLGVLFEWGGRGTAALRQKSVRVFWEGTSVRWGRPGADSDFLRKLQRYLLKKITD